MCHIGEICWNRVLLVCVCLCECVCQTVDRHLGINMSVTAVASTVLESNVELPLSTLFKLVWLLVVLPALSCCHLSLCSWQKIQTKSKDREES